LVIGFQNSGTTMLRRLLCCHPEIRNIFHETFYLNDTNRREHVRTKIMNKHKFDIDNCVWGEKIPFIYPRMSRSKIGPRNSIVDYARRWKKYFTPDYRIIHIVRHPVDVILGNNRTKAIKPEKTIKWYEDTVFLAIRKFEESAIIKYEDILLNFDVSMGNLFSSIGLSSNKEVVDNVEEQFNERFGGLNYSRAFGYGSNKRYGSLDNKFQNLRKIIKGVNNFAGGIVKYIG